MVSSSISDSIMSTWNTLENIYPFIMNISKFFTAKSKQTRIRLRRDTLGDSQSSKL